MGESITTQPWPGGRSATGEAVGVAVLLPGAGYGVELPLLHWTAAVLAQQRWFVQSVRWDPDGVDRSSASRFTARAAELAFEQAPQLERRLVVGKSLGTFAAPWAKARGVPGIWLTPLLMEPAVREALTTGGQPCLLVGATGDSSWDAGVAAESGHRVCELEGLNHSLDEPADWRRSLAAVEHVCESVEAFLAVL
jgi:hypothetical protein